MVICGHTIMPNISWQDIETRALLLEAAYAELVNISPVFISKANAPGIPKVQKSFFKKNHRIIRGNISTQSCLKRKKL